MRPSADVKLGLLLRKWHWGGRGHGPLPDLAPSRRSRRQFQGQFVAPHAQGCFLVCVVSCFVLLVPTKLVAPHAQGCFCSDFLVTAHLGTVQQLTTAAQALPFAHAHQGIGEKKHVSFVLVQCSFGLDQNSIL